MAARRRARPKPLSQDVSSAPPAALAPDAPSPPSPSLCAAGTGTFWLARVVFLRGLGLVYFVAFLVAFNQNPHLIGSEGLDPSTAFMARMQRQVPANASAWQRMNKLPTLLWFVPPESHDSALALLAISGAAISLVVTLRGAASAAMMAALWLAYHSISSVGQRWYGFGWESQLLETGFLAIFLCPLANPLSLARFPENLPTPVVCVWGYRWLLFRIMIGAGLIKIRGDQCWRDLSCMQYHYETQPVPSPSSWFLHASPTWFHAVEVAVNHFVELVAPWGCLLPSRPFGIANGILQITFQIILIASGNLSFLNWLTLLPAIFHLDDRCLAPLFYGCGGADRLAEEVAKSRGDREDDDEDGDDLAMRLRQPGGGPGVLRKAVHLCLGATLAYLSVPVLQNLVSSRQVMNTSFGAWSLLNTYGAFGSITKERHEVILSGRDDRDGGGAGGGAGVWKEYEFHCKPGDPKRRPCLITPYHYRLDWLMWFAAFRDYNSDPYIIHLAVKLLRGGPASRKISSGLLASDPFPDPGSPPAAIKAELWRYEYTTREEAQDEAGPHYGAWWKRRKVKEYMPAITLGQNSVMDFLRQHGWAAEGEKLHY